MALYEHVFIARQDLSNAQAEGLIEHFGQILKDNGGDVQGSEYWGVRTLQYKINKNRKGHYAFLKTNSPAAAVAETYRQLEMPSRLREVGVPEDGVKQIAVDSMTDFGITRNVRPVKDAAELDELLKQIW